MGFLSVEDEKEIKGSSQRLEPTFMISGLIIGFLGFNNLFILGGAFIVIVAVIGNRLTVNKAGDNIYLTTKKKVVKSTLNKRRQIK